MVYTKVFFVCGVNFHNSLALSSNDGFSSLAVKPTHKFFPAYEIVTQTDRKVLTNMFLFGRKCPLFDNKARLIATHSLIAKDPSFKT